jgi:Astacin (Peptidase family M12A)
MHLSPTFKLITMESKPLKKKTDPKCCIDLDNYFINYYDKLLNEIKAKEENLLTEKNLENVDFETAVKDRLITDSEIRSVENAKEKLENLILELALVKSKMWASGKHLKVKFLDGTDYLKQKVIYYAKTWEQHANITFDFVEDGDTQIRISFKYSGSWSYVGKDALNISNQNEPTMNYGWFDEETSEEEFRRTIVHEFGHCLGCIHEHQSPASNIPWNKEVVYEYYWRTQKWDRVTVDINLFQKFDQNEITNSVFDRRSIMLYPIDSRLTTNGYSVGWNRELSSEDISYIGKCYPKTDS